MERNCPASDSADAKSSLVPAGLLRGILPDGTRFVQHGYREDGTPIRTIERPPAVPPDAPPATPETPAELRARVETTRARWMDCGPGDASYTIWAKADVADWWNAARRIPGAAPPPPMPEINDDPQTGLAAADLMLQWLDDLEAPQKSEDESERAPFGARGPALTPEAKAILIIQQTIKATGKLPTKTEVAAQLDVDRRTLHNWKAFKTAYAAMKAKLMRSLPKGIKSKDGDMEAWRESGK